MSSSKKLDLGLQSAYDELFMNEQGRAENRLPKIYDIPLSEIDEFPNHPYQVRMDEDMTQLVESVKERGIITPVILRKKEDGRYEMVSGHRRMKACELAGLETVKADVQDLTRDEAIILVTARRSSSPQHCGNTTGRNWWAHRPAARVMPRSPCP